MSFLVGGAAAAGLFGTGAATLTGVSAGAGIGAIIGKSLMGGFGAQTKDEAAEQERLAGVMKQEQLDLLGDQRGSAVSGANLGMAAAQSQFAGGQRDVSMGTQMGMRGIQAGAATAASRSGLATSGTIEQQTKTQTGDLMAKYKSDMTKLFETRDLSRTQADLSYRKGEMSAEEAYESTLTGLESQPTGFLEGMFS